MKIAEVSEKYDISQDTQKCHLKITVAFYRNMTNCPDTFK